MSGRNLRPFEGSGMIYDSYGFDIYNFGYDIV